MSILLSTLAILSKVAAEPITAPVTISDASRLESTAVQEIWTMPSDPTLAGANAGMAYGRLCVVPGEKTFLRRAILNVYERVPEEIPELKPPNRARLRRTVFRAQAGSKSGKRLRWVLEKRDGRQEHNAVSCNQLLNEGSAVFQVRGARRADILHEYFIPHGIDLLLVETNAFRVDL